MFKSSNKPTCLSLESWYIFILSVNKLAQRGMGNEAPNTCRRLRWPGATTAMLEASWLQQNLTSSMLWSPLCFSFLSGKFQHWSRRIWGSLDWRGDHTTCLKLTPLWGQGWRPSIARTFFPETVRRSSKLNVTCLIHTMCEGPPSTTKIFGQSPTYPWLRFKEVEEDPYLWIRFSLSTLQCHWR